MLLLLLSCIDYAHYKKKKRTLPQRSSKLRLPCFLRTQDMAVSPTFFFLVFSYCVCSPVRIQFIAICSASTRFSFLLFYSFAVFHASFTLFPYSNKLVTFICIAFVYIVFLSLFRWIIFSPRTPFQVFELPSKPVRTRIQIRGGIWPCFTAGPFADDTCILCAVHVLSHLSLLFLYPLRTALSMNGVVRHRITGAWRHPLPMSQKPFLRLVSARVAHYVA